MKQNTNFFDTLTPEEKKYLQQEAFLNSVIGAPAPADIEEWAKKVLCLKIEREEEERLKQEQKENKKQQKAKALNMTYEQYEIYRKKQLRISRYKTEIKKCQKLLTQIQQDKLYWEHKLQLAEQE